MKGNIVYQRDVHNTYLIMKDCINEILDSFTGQMVQKGKIEGISACVMRFMDGKREISYDISSLTGLEQAFSVKEISYDVLCSMIRQIMRLMDVMEENLTDKNGVCLSPEYIFVDTSTDRLSFIYDFTQYHERSSIQEFAEYCLERVDHQEDRAVDLAFYLYEHARGEYFSLKEVEEYLEKRAAEVSSENRGREIPLHNQASEVSMETRPAGVSLEKHVTGASLENRIEEESLEKRAMKISALGTGHQRDIEDNGRSGAYNTPAERVRTHKGHTVPRRKIEDTDTVADTDRDEKMDKILSIAPIASIGISVIFILLYFVSGIFFVFEPWVEVALISVSGILSAAGVVVCIYNRRREIDSEDDREDTNMSDMILDPEEDSYKNGFIRKREVPPEEKRLWEDMVEEQERRHREFSREYERRKSNGGTADGDAMDPSQTGLSVDADGSAYDGRTVYVGHQEHTREHSLIGRRRGRDTEYPIQRFPWIIGKDRDRSNMQIKESSVSRIHARLIMDEGDIFVEDLASTNGTCLNDLPLAPHEPMKLRRGDVLLFGRAEYVFE